MSKDLIVATSNLKKLAEIQRILGPDSDWNLKSLTDMNFEGQEPEENEASFEGNALLKARYASTAAGLVSMASVWAGLVLGDRRSRNRIKARTASESSTTLAAGMRPASRHTT